LAKPINGVRKIERLIWSGTRTDGGFDVGEAVLNVIWRSIVNVP
jgi:hypothetical protein